MHFKYFIIIKIVVLSVRVALIELQKCGRFLLAFYLFVRRWKIFESGWHLLWQNRCRLFASDFVWWYSFLIYSVVLTWRMLTNYSKRYKIRQHLFEYIVLAYLLVIHAKGLSFMYCPEHMMIILFYYLHLNREKLAVFR